jgi:hypothetical protein
MEIYVRLEVNPEVIAVALTPEWQANFYVFQNERDVLDHLAYNLVINNARLSQLDGWADRPDSDCVVVAMEVS